MIIKLRGADFSADNIGTVSTDLNLLDYTKAAILASGNETMDDYQKLALDSFFRSLGAGENDGIITKMRKIYLPIICNDVTKGLINYADENFTDDGPLSSSVWSLRNRGLVGSATTPAINETLSNPLLATNFSVFWLRTERMVSGTNDSQYVAVFRGKTNTNLWCGPTEVSASSNSMVSWGQYGTNWSTNTVKSSITAVKTAALICRGANDVDRNIYGVWDSTLSGLTLADFSNESSESLYVLGLGSNNQLKPYAVVMVGEAVTLEQGKAISSAIDAMWDVFKPSTPEVPGE